MKRRVAVRAAVLLTLATATGCAGMPAALAPGGRQAQQISQLWWLFFGITLAVYGFVLAALAYATLRPRGNDEAREADTQRRMTLTIGGSVAATVVLLFVLLVASVVTGASVGGYRDNAPITIEVMAQQWWWEIIYEAPESSNIVRTANEIHIPTGRAIRVRLASRDVIHSFWVPQLTGKRDAIPGHASEIWMRADTPGIYPGRCAEFCGWQHAKMGLFVIADPPGKFQAWLSAQRQPAQGPATPEAQRGQQVFLSSQCVMCHTITGTRAAATVGPDLTHLASRHTIAAGSLANTRGHLGGWIVNPQQAKPGNKMPSNLVASGDLQALLTYLEGLK